MAHAIQWIRLQWEWDTVQKCTSNDLSLCVLEVVLEVQGSRLELRRLVPRQSQTLLLPLPEQVPPRLPALPLLLVLLRSVASQFLLDYFG